LKLKTAWSGSFAELHLAEKWFNPTFASLTKTPQI
jgi:hypothetical protein